MLSVLVRVCIDYNIEFHSVLTKNSGLIRITETQYRCTDYAVEQLYTRDWKHRYPPSSAGGPWCLPPILECIHLIPTTCGKILRISLESSVSRHRSPTSLFEAFVLQCIVQYVPILPACYNPSGRHRVCHRYGLNQQTMILGHRRAQNSQ
ncbi:hypothetical protein FIBSPDRAFT_318871 [Athelia psychrophila]|uniref:Uncharacterized protein n=1 Tax=Athelia psychrophila TaxID=1759441 RepID=A0A167WSJ7_9AGAM|nr:hypothetical protein FIBSPDRAFT_318871 [Fibularhizoctonia sp. CBS 109695]